MEKLIEDASGGRHAPTEPSESPQKGRQGDKTPVLHASNQIAPDSYLGDILGQEKKSLTKRQVRYGDDDSEDSSDDDSSDSDSSSPDSSDTSDSESEDSRDGRHHHRKKRKIKYKPLTLTTPDKYSSEADPLKFYRFVTQCERLCREAWIPKQDQVAKCADSLTGKAFKFYTTVVSMELKKWKLDKFFVELFNYCFPPDFRLRQRSKLNDFEQKHLHVSEYAAELLVMFCTIGSSTKREHIEKLWNGLRPELQQVLWRENLEPQHSTWKQVLRVAECHEIADRIIANDKQSTGNGTNGSKNQNNCQRPFNSGGNGILEAFRLI